MMLAGLGMLAAAGLPERASPHRQGPADAGPFFVLPRVLLGHDTTFRTAGNSRGTALGLVFVVVCSVQSGGCWRIQHVRTPYGQECKDRLEQVKAGCKDVGRHCQYIYGA